MKPITSMRPIQLSRSNLIVPLSNEPFIAKAHLRGSDVITLDLEDGVAPSAKSAARDRLASAVQEVGRLGTPVRVRINQPLELAVRDIEAAVIAGVSSLAITKVDSAGHVRLIAELVERLEAEKGLEAGSIAFTAAIETPEALTRVNEIAAAHPRLRSIHLGSEDLSAACGFLPTAESLLGPMQTILIAAKAAGIQSFGYVGSIANYSDLEAMRTTIRRSRLLGFRGGSAIHPAQVAILNEEFSSPKEDVDHAQEIIDAAQIAFARGLGAFPVRGKMIDKPIVDRAMETLAFAQAAEEHDRKFRDLKGC